MRGLHPAVWTRVALAHPRLSIAIAVLATSAALAGMLRLETEVGYRAFLGPNHPVVREFDAFVERFGGGLPLVAVWSCEASPACASALDDGSLAMAAEVAARCAKIEGVARIDSPATTPVLARQLIGLPEMRFLVRDGAPVADVAALREQVLADPSWLRRLVSGDGSAGAIVLHLRDSAGDAARRAYDGLREALSPYERAGFEFYFVGGPVEFVVAGDELQSNTQRIMPVMIGLIAIALMVLFGAPAAAAVALASVGLALLWTLGAMGWLGWKQNSLTQILPPLVLVVGVCDAIHLIGRFGRSRPERGAAAITAAASGVGAACAMTTATTVAGFASLAVSDLESIARFGVLAALGVIASLVVTFTLVPLLVTALPPRWFVDRAGGRWGRALEPLAGWVLGAGRKPILAVTIGLAALGLWGAQRLQFDASFEDLYGKSSNVVRWAHQAARYLRAPDTLEIALQAPPGSTGIPSDGFALVDRIERELSEIESLGPALSIVDVMRRLNRLLHGDELPLDLPEDDMGRPSSVYRLLRSRDPAATNDLVDGEGGALRLSIESTKPPQGVLRTVLATVRGTLERELPPGWSAIVTGPVAVVGRMIDAIRLTQLESFALAGLSVFAMVAFFFRSLRLASIAMVPTVLPAIVTLGVMGALGIALDIGSAMVASVILGVAVDDAIHMLARYRQARAEGAPAPSASRAAMVTTGRAVVTTSIALSIGFAVLTLSAWNSIATFGVIACVAVLVALLAAVLVLPILAARLC